MASREGSKRDNAKDVAFNKKDAMIGYKLLENDCPFPNDKVSAAVPLSWKVWAEFLIEYMLGCSKEYVSVSYACACVCGCVRACTTEVPAK